jgi:hypothetical protein
MAKFIFYTDEGYTIAPDNSELESLQILGFENASNLKEGIRELFTNNPWIKESGFKTRNIKYRLILENNDLKDLKTLIQFLYIDEKRNYEESDQTKDHIFLVIERLKNIIN